MIEAYTKEFGGSILEEKTTKKKWKSIGLPAALLSIICLLILVIVLIVTGGLNKEEGSVPAGADADNPEKTEQELMEEEKARAEAELEAAKLEVIAKADRLAASYDYDAAVAYIQAYDGYAEDTRFTDKIAEYEATKASCVPVDLKEVTHIFYHSLVVDPERAFANQDKNPQAVGNNQWMTTVSEFNKITQEMYDRGYVLVSIHDLYEEVVNENGETEFVEGTIMLPPGKKAFVLSLDDLCYYHSYDGYGYASKMVLDENGEPTCEYIQADGTVVTGAYDVVPLMDAFVKEHPDASYRGAKGIIALTGYNGVLGYRTDVTYANFSEDLSYVKQVWIKEHPDFDLEKERAEAKKVADAMKENGWEFASHTWGHVAVGSASLERIKTDTGKWKSYVEPLVGETDIIVFAHGEDIGSWRGYSADNEKFQYLKSEGFNYFCNVDSTQYFLQIRDNYVRMGRRNLDGYRLWNDVHKDANLLTDLFDASEIIDPKRTDMPSW